MSDNAAFSPIRFNPDRVAFLETEGWKAYYDRRWLRVFRLIVILNREEFRIPFPQSWRAAYFIARATKLWAPIEHDEARVELYLYRFYRLACRYAGLKTDAATAARLEVRYWEVHRRLLEEADKTEFVTSLISLHSALFDIAPEAALESAQERVEASNTVDRIVLNRSSDRNADWRSLEEHLRRCYRSIAEHVGRSTLVEVMG